jgi:hypothetical protein
MVHIASRIFILGLCLYSNILLCQSFVPSPQHPEWFKAIPLIDDDTPEWAKLMYTDETKFDEIVAAKEKYYSTHPFVKNLHTQNFKHWFKIVSNFVQEDGTILMTSEQDRFRTFEREKASNGSDGSRMNTWTCIGPNSTYEAGPVPKQLCTQVNAFCLGVAPSNPNVVYAGMETGGIFKTTNKGLNWFPVSYTYSIGSPKDIKVHPTNENIVFVVVNAVLYKSIDGGTTWNLAYTFASNVDIVIFDPITPSIMYAGTISGLYKSTDGGLSWTIKFTGEVQDIAFKPGTPTTLYLSYKNGATKRPEIFKSLDSGDTWTIKANGYYSPSNFTVAQTFGCKIGVTAADPERVYAAIAATGKSGDNGWIAVYHSTDGAETWINASGYDGASINDNDGTWSYPTGNNMNTPWFVAGYEDGYHQGWYNFDLDVSHTNPDKFWLGTIWLCESANKGANIEYIRGTRSLVAHADVQDIDVVGNDIWIASDGGINYSNDQCQTTSVRINGITASDFWGFGQGWNEDTWIGGRYHNGNAGFHENYPAGNTVFLGGAEAATGYVHPMQNRSTYTSDAGADKLPLSLNVGAKSISNLGLMPNESYYHFNYSEVEWHPINTNVVFVGKTDKLYKSTNGGATFAPLYTFPSLTNNTTSVRRYEICRDDPNYIYVLTYRSSSTWTIFKSTDGGVTFTILPTPTISGGSWRDLSLTLNPFNKNEVWIASNTSSNGNKIFRSIDGGNTWINKYTATLANHSIKDIIFHPSTAGDKVYAMTNNNFFYHDINTGVWTQYNTGLPVDHGGFKMLPFFRDNKIRMATNKGIWEAPFTNNPKPQALPQALLDSVFCVRDTIQLDSRSILLDEGASYNWSFSSPPAYISNATVRNPRVVFTSNGNINVTLTVTQSDGQTNTQTITGMIKVSSQCGVDKYPGKSLLTFANGDGAVSSGFERDSIRNFTITGWWKPDGAQQPYAALVSSGDWCAHCTDTEGLIFDYNGNKLWYKWPGLGNTWGNNSGMTVPLNVWSYVALTIEPTKATLYLNDQKYVHNRPLYGGSIQDLFIGFGHYDKSFKGEIDEVTVWNRTLSEDEIRLIRHLTKEGQVQNDGSLIAYYQFNSLSNQGLILDKTGGNHANFKANATLTNSSAPVASGSSQMLTINGAGTYNTTVGMDLTFGTGTYPNGKVVISRLDYRPNVVPGGIKPISQSSWIMNNYGTNANFTGLTSLRFKNTGLVTPSSTANVFRLYSRGENEHNATWLQADIGDQYNTGGYDIIYDGGLSFTTDGQISMFNGAAKGWTGGQNNLWDNVNNWGDGLLPAASDEVIIPAYVPYHPIVNISALIKFMLLQPAAKLEVNAPNTLRIKP